MFSHLRSHSYYSFLEGLPSPAELVQAAKDAGMPALALTDHHILSGAIEFFRACDALQVQPILGLEIDLAAPGALAQNSSGKIVLLASDMEGWACLCRLSSALQTEPGQSQVLPIELLAQNAGGLVCLSGGKRGLLAGLLRNGMKEAAAAYLGALSELFPGRLYAEVQRHTPEDRAWVMPLAALALRLKIPLVATHDIYYLKPEQAALQRLVTAMRQNCRIEETPAQETAPPSAHFLDRGEMSRRFEDTPAALEASQEIADRCRLRLPLGVPHYPEMPLPPGLTPAEQLRQEAADGAKSLYGQLTEEIRERLDRELAVIEEYGYASLFLIAEEVLGFARRSGVPVSSRGSAASSLVAHCLGITTPDPIRLNLYFERFLNPARLTPPDIDTDLCSRRRDGVIRFVYERFGEERVAMVCTINRFRRRSALRAVAKAYGLPAEEISALADALPRRQHGPHRSARGEEPFAGLAARYRSALHQTVFRDAAALLGVPDHLSIHPGGIVIAPGRLTDLVPTQMAAKGVVVTQFDLEAVEHLGLVKLDLLGIRGLTVLGDVAESIQHAQPGHYKNPLDVLEAIPNEDTETADLVRSGRTIGCFQIESPGMRATLKQIHADSVDDLMVALALYRPGPLTGGLKDAFVRRHRGEEAVEHIHPALRSLLEDTYGVILYQEQVLRIAHELAGLSLADSDLLRRAMSHFDPGKQMISLKKRFIAGAGERNGVPEEVGERIWELMAAFAGYGFPKAHAASYALVSWRAAWCKVHHPAVFMAAVLANWGGYYGQRTYLMEARHMGLAVRPPQVNYAQKEFCVSYPEGKPVLFMGLDQVRDLTRRTQSRILAGQPFHSWSDFIARVDPRPVEAENLVKAGALEGFGTIPGLLRQLKGGSARGGQLVLFDLEAPEGEDWSLEEKVAAQEVILGVGVAAHPLELAAAQVAASGAISTLDAAGRVGERVRLAGTRFTWRRTQTARGEALYFTTLEDLEGTLDVLISSAVHRRYQNVITTPAPGLIVIEGVVEVDEETGEPIIQLEKAWKLG